MESNYKVQSYYTWNFHISGYPHCVTVLAYDAQHAKRKAWALLHKAKSDVQQKNEKLQKEKQSNQPLYGYEKTNSSSFVLFQQGCYCQDLETVLEEFKKMLYETEPTVSHKNCLIISSCLDG